MFRALPNQPPSAACGGFRELVERGNMCGEFVATKLLVYGERTCDAGCSDGVHLQHGTDVHELIFPAVNQ